MQATDVRAFALIVCTRNRPKELSRLLESVLVETNERYVRDLVVIDQSDSEISENNRRSIQCYSQAAPSVRMLHVADDNRGLSIGRNKGLGLIRSPGVICFPDDDCWYPHLFFAELIGVIEGSRAEVIQTYYREPSQDNPKKPINGVISRSNAYLLRACSVGIFIDTRRTRGLGMYFDERLGVGTSLPGGEEVDLLYRLITSGVTIEQITYPYVYHKISRERLEPSAALYAARAYVKLKNYKIKRNLSIFIIGLLANLLFSPFRKRDRLALSGKYSAIRMYAASRWFKGSPSIMD